MVGCVMDCASPGGGVHHTGTDTDPEGVAHPGTFTPQHQPPPTPSQGMNRRHGYCQVHRRYREGQAHEPLGVEQGSQAGFHKVKR